MASYPFAQQLFSKIKMTTTRMIIISFLLLVIGCDGIVGSDKRLDACGVCGGDNSTCQIISGIFTEPHLPAGYNHVAQIPKGACHINITELKPSRNYLALRRADGSFVFNGNWAINWSGEYQAAGATFIYRRQDVTTPEFISSEGPLTEPIELMVIYQQINPGIKYEYMLPLGLANPSLPRPSLPVGIPNLPQNDLAPTVNGVSNRWQDSGGQLYGTNSGSTGISSNIQSSSSLGAGNLPSNPGNPAIVQGSTLGSQSFPNPSFPNRPLSGLNDPTSSNRNSPAVNQSFSSLSSKGSLASFGIVPQFDPNVDPNQSNPLQPATSGTGASSGPQISPPLVNDGRPNHHSGHSNGRNQGRRRPHGHKNSGSLESQGKHGHSSDLQGTDANVDRRGPRRHGNGKNFVWKHVGFSECSKTCGGGLQQSLIVCVRETNQAPVADHRCKEEDRPTSETLRCNTKPCPAEWVYSEWSSCSVTCGEGIQTRELSCKQEISPTLTMKVNEAACLTTPPSLPKIRSCNLTPCARWQTSEWGTCSTECGKGMRHRRITCMSFDGKEASESDCSSADKPVTSEVCDMGSCSTNTWFFTEWTGHCSEDCGAGIQTRKAHCSGASEDVCDAAKKPEISRTCVSNKDCNGKWFAGPWSQCSSTCDEGSQTREVVCLTFLRGQYRVGLDMQCSARDKPESRRACNLGPCLPQWYMSDWSECSATCGTGAQRREVKCLDSNQVISQECREEDRPIIRQACNTRTCPSNEVSDIEETTREAQDTPVANGHGNYSESEPTETIKSRKSGKLAKIQSKTPTSATAPSEASDDSVTASVNATGDSCVDKFKNCHLVVQARLCKLKYYLVSCCASCSKPKT